MTRAEIRALAHTYAARYAGENGVTLLRLKELCRAEGIRLISYKHGAQLLAELGLEEHTRGNDAFCIPALSRVIFYNSEREPDTVRGNIAHELGHLLTVSEPANVELAELRADSFAFNLLFPDVARSEGGAARC